MKAERFSLDRLNEYAPTYFDLTSFPDGEMKRALERANKKSKGKVAQGEKKDKVQLDKKTNSRQRRKAKLET